MLGETVWNKVNQECSWYLLSIINNYTGINTPLTPILFNTDPVSGVSITLPLVWIQNTEVCITRKVNYCGLYTFFVNSLNSSGVTRRQRFFMVLNKSGVLER